MVATMDFECAYPAKRRFKKSSRGWGEASEIGSKVLGPKRSLEGDTAFFDTAQSRVRNGRQDYVIGLRN
jgi:hypothetical protein